MPVLIFDCFGVLVVSRRELSDISEIFQNRLEKNEQLLNFITAKKHEGSKIAIISNVAQYSFDQLFNKEEQQLFDEIILSGNEKVSKPDSRIFEIALERLGEQPENCVMIDDAPENIAAAEKLGLRGILYQDFESFKVELEKLNA
jgi:epoxide hydrolase-like predicted phosphatase